MTIGPYPGSNGVTCTTTHLIFVGADEEIGILFQHGRFKDYLNYSTKAVA